jgi:hypothetical protein
MSGFFKLTVFGYVMVVSVGLLQLGLAQPRVEHPVVQDLAGTFQNLEQAVNGKSRGPI